MALKLKELKGTVAVPTCRLQQPHTEYAQYNGNGSQKAVTSPRGPSSNCSALLWFLRNDVMENLDQSVELFSGGSFREYIGQNHLPPCSNQMYIDYLFI